MASSQPNLELPLTRAEWVQSTAGSAHRVDQNVHISGYLAAADPAFIRGAGITRIVKLFADDTSYPGGFHRHKGVAYLVLAADDDPGYDIRPDAMAAIRFIQAGLANGDQILVHCHAGVSRSATIVLLHLMINRNYGLDLALSRLRSTRDVISPNPGFMAHLRATDARLTRLRRGDEKPFIGPPPVFGQASDAPLDPTPACVPRPRRVKRPPHAPARPPI